MIYRQIKSYCFLFTLLEIFFTWKKKEKEKSNCSAYKHYIQSNENNLEIRSKGDKVNSV